MCKAFLIFFPGFAIYEQYISYEESLELFKTVQITLWIWAGTLSIICLPNQAILRSS